MFIHQHCTHIYKDFYYAFRLTVNKAFMVFALSELHLSFAIMCRAEKALSTDSKYHNHM